MRSADYDCSGFQIEPTPLIISEKLWRRYLEHAKLFWLGVRDTRPPAEKVAEFGRVVDLDLALVSDADIDSTEIAPFLVGQQDYNTILGYEAGVIAHDRWDHLG